MHKGIKHIKKKYRLKRKTKDIDEIQDEIKMRLEKPESKPKLDIDLPGMGLNYCEYCARHFIDAKVLAEHQKTKTHKKRVKRVKEDQYTQAEADWAAGLLQE